LVPMTAATRPDSLNAEGFVGGTKVTVVFLRKYGQQEYAGLLFFPSGFQERRARSLAADFCRHRRVDPPIKPFSRHRPLLSHVHSSTRRPFPRVPVSRVRTSPYSSPFLPSPTQVYAAAPRTSNPSRSPVFPGSSVTPEVQCTPEHHARFFGF